MYVLLYRTRFFGLTSSGFSEDEDACMDKTLLKGLMVLEAVTSADGAPATVDELAKRVGLTRSNAHRTLQTLMHAGYVTKDPNGGYRGTIRLFELGARQLAQLDIRKAAMPSMRVLAKQCDETVHLSVLDGIDVVYIEKIDSSHPIRAYSMVGGRAPAYAVATGKALLAHQEEGYVQRHLKNLRKYTHATLSLQELKAELSKVVRLGYAVNRGEWREGVGGLAVVIFDGMGQPVAAVGISGPLERLTSKRMKELAPLVQASARAISRSMGHRESETSAKEMQGR